MTTNPTGSRPFGHPTATGACAPVRIPGAPRTQRGNRFGSVLLLLCLVVGATQLRAQTYALGTRERLEGPGAGLDSVVLAVTRPGQTWTAVSNDAWLHVDAANGWGAGSRNVVFSYDANPGSTRTGTLTVAGQTLTVTQAGSNYVAARPLTTLASSEFFGCAGIAVDGAGNVYFSSVNTPYWAQASMGLSNRVLKWSSIDGQVSQVLSFEMAFFALKVRGSDLAVDSAGDLYFGTYIGRHSQVQKRSATDGTASVLFDSPSLVGRGIPILGLAVDGPGNVYFVDSEERVIKRRSAATAEVTTLFHQGSFFTLGVAVDGAGNVYMSDRDGNSVTKWTAADGIAETLISSGLNEPLGLAVDGAGNVYIADSKNHAIKKWTAADGRLTTLVALESALPSEELPAAVAVDANGGIYFTVAEANDYVIPSDRVQALANAFVDPGPIRLTAAAGTEVLPAVLPASQNLRGPLFAPASDQAWLTITGITNGVVSFSYTANDTSAARRARISLLGTNITITQDPAGTAALAPTLTGPIWLSDGGFQLMFKGLADTSYSVLFSTNPALPLSSWTVAGPATSAVPGRASRLLMGTPAQAPPGIGGTATFQFTHRPAGGTPNGFYRVVSP